MIVFSPKSQPQPFLISSRTRFLLPYFWFEGRRPRKFKLESSEETRKKTKMKKPAADPPPPIWFYQDFITAVDDLRSLLSDVDSYVEARNKCAKLKSSLYVGDLHPDVTEEDLTETFSRVGTLLSVRLCCDRFSGSSLRYAYVNFWLPYHVFAAMKSLNHTALKGKRMRIMLYEKDPIARRDNNGNLFVKNLDKSITSALVQQIFSKYGTVLSCKVADENGVSKGFGFVQFESVNSAIAARSALHDSLLGSKKLYVSKFLRKKERFGEEVDFRSLYVKNLDEDITDNALKARFSQYGTVSNAVIMKDGNGRSKGLGFVNFDSHEAAKRAMVFLNGELLLVDGWYQKTFRLLLIHFSLYVSDSDEIEDAEGSGKYEDEEVVIPLKNMKKWLERRPRGFGEGKVYDTSIENKLMEEIEWENSFLLELPGDPRTDSIPREILHSCYSRISPSAEVDNPQLFAWSDSICMA